MKKEFVRLHVRERHQLKRLEQLLEGGVKEHLVVSQLKLVLYVHTLYQN
jgi:hypothetical protein